MTPETVAAVLERLGIERPARDLAGLRTVYAAWCRGVPFDSVLKMIHVAEKRTGPLPGSTSEDFFAAWIRWGVGGTCWAGNGALHDLLAALGFEVERVIATMMPGQSRAPNHGSVAVRLEGSRWLADASMLTGEPIRIPEQGEPAPGGPLPRFEWLDGRPALVWRTLRDPEGFPCRIEWTGAGSDEWDDFHARTGAWSPFNYELSARLVRGTATIGVSPGYRFAIEADGTMTSSPQDHAARRRFLVEELGIAEELASRLPDDRPVPPRPAT
jgi:N-hydroxyarylamine O-acetyltransferase